MVYLTIIMMYGKIRKIINLKNWNKIIKFNNKNKMKKRKKNILVTIDLDFIGVMFQIMMKNGIKNNVKY